jgi:hypothetical protein
MHSCHSFSQYHHEHQKTFAIPAHSLCCGSGVSCYAFRGTYQGSPENFVIKVFKNEESYANEKNNLTMLSNHKVGNIPEIVNREELKTVGGNWVLVLHSVGILVQPFKLWKHRSQ